MSKPIITNENLSADKANSEVFDFVLTNLSEDRSYYVGSGITVTELSDEGKVLSSNLALYPVYADDELYAMVLKDSAQKLTYIDDLNVDDKQIRNGLVIVNNGNTYLINESGEAMPLRKKSDSFKKEILEKIELRKNESNDFGDNRIMIKEGSSVVDPSSGRKYSSTRLVVKFTEGDIEKKISNFEEFCSGKLKRTIKSAGIYVFEIESSDFTKLSSLINQAKQLDYVQDIQLDEQREAH